MGLLENFTSLTYLVPDGQHDGVTAVSPVPVIGQITSEFANSLDSLKTGTPVTVSLDGLPVIGRYIGFISADGSSVPVIQTPLGLFGLGFSGRPLQDYTINSGAMPCFLAGTRITTPAGEVQVEDLAVGDLVSTVSGAARPIRWIGRRAFSAADARVVRLIQPVCLRAGSLGQGLPKRDLFLSPEHCLMLDGYLVRAESLINGASISRTGEPGEIVYYHIELETHDVISAEGVAVETYRDDRSQMLFDERRPETLPPAPTEPCLPVLEEGEMLAALRAGLEAATVQMVWLPEEGSFRFPIAPGMVAVRLRSDGQRIAGDSRRLGVAISEIRRDGEPLPLAARQLMAGWHAAEGGWRWTDGGAILLLDGARMLEITVSAVPEQRAAA
ncbi:Hint domain-containing protein [Acidisoma sp. C75]